MPEYRLTLLGAFGLSAGAPCAVPSKKGQALLALLAIPLGQPHRRDKLAKMLWSGLSEDAARQNLRQCLTTLRRVCHAGEAPPIILKDGLLGLDAARVTVDVCDFEEAVRGRDPGALARASAIYRGELLEGLDLEESPFEEWLIGERRRLRTIAVENLCRLLTHHEESGDREQATQTAVQLLGIDPLQEHVHRTLMRLHYERGNTAQALKQYAICEKILRRELAVEPEATTKDLRKMILRSRGFTSSRSGIDDVEARFLDDQSSLPANSEAPVLDIEQKSAAPLPVVRSPLGRPRLSIVVLPFANLGDNKPPEDFVDGVTETLTTAISHLPDYFVLSCKTAFTYKGKAIDARQIGRELDVRYVLQGSIQSGADRLRVSAQLIDAESGAHLWADQFDKPWADLFDIQDEITARLARDMDVQLVVAEARRLEREGPKDLDSVDLALRGWTISFRKGSVAGAREARAIFEEALRIDSTNVDVLIGLVEGHALEVNSYMSPAPAEQVRLAEVAMSKALELAPLTARMHFGRAALLVALRAPEQALREIELAMNLDPGLPHVHVRAGWIKIFLGCAEEADGHVANAMRLSSRDRMLGHWYSVLGLADLHLGRIDEAVDHLRKGVNIAPNHELPYFFLSAALALQGHKSEAARTCEMGRRLAPIFQIGKCRTEVQSDNPLFLRQRERIYEGLKKAGLPE